MAKIDLTQYGITLSLIHISSERLSEIRCLILRKISGKGK